MVRASGQDASWMPPWGGVSGMPILKEPPGETKDTLERFSLSAGLGTSWFPPGGVGGSGRGEGRGCLDLPAQTVASATRTRARKQNKIIHFMVYSVSLSKLVVGRDTFFKQHIKVASI